MNAATTKFLFEIFERAKIISFENPKKPLEKRDFDKFENKFIKRLGNDQH